MAVAIFQLYRTTLAGSSWRVGSLRILAAFYVTNHGIAHVLMTLVQTL